MAASRKPICSIQGLIILILLQFSFLTVYMTYRATRSELDFLKAAAHSVRNPFPATEVFVYRYGNNVTIPVIEPLLDLNNSPVENMIYFLDTIRMKTGDPSISRLVTRVGAPVLTFPDVLNSMNPLLPFPERGVIALDGVERFFWPVDVLHHTYRVVTEDGRSVGVTPIYASPRVFELDGFLSGDEVNHFVSWAVRKKRAGKMFESTVGGDEKSSARRAEYRDSSQLWVGPEQNNDDEIFHSVRDRAVDITRLERDLTEETQIVYYKSDGRYYGHHDYIDRDLNSYYRGGGNRLVTLLYYLSDVDQGGETVFPFAQDNRPTQAFGKLSCSVGGLAVKPQKGKVVMFYSLQEKGHMDGESDPYSFHASCPTGENSEKWLANQWIRNKRVNGKLIDEFR